MKSPDQYWYSKNLFAWLLLPLSWLFCAVAMLRRGLYSGRVLPSAAIGAPVIIVGNISVGGTGKTPLLIGLCEHLTASGYRPGVISRGYGANISGEHFVSADDDAQNCGDEPVLIAQRTGRPVVVGRNRVAAAEKLLAESDCNVILSDDGLQHYRLRRDIEIAVVDAEREFGNGFCLPAGPLREPVSRLDSVDMVVYNGSVRGDYHFMLEPGKAVNLKTAEQRPLASFAAGGVHAVAGIGHPDRFFRQMSKLGLKVETHAFPDHHDYSAGDVSFEGKAPVLMTEKDAVKISKLLSDRQLGDNSDRYWSVPVEARLSQRLCSDLIKLIEQSR